MSRSEPVQGESRPPQGPLFGAPDFRGKRLFDLALVLLSAPLWIPLIIAVALVVRARLGKPVCFTQMRIGLGERTFRMIKFRSMTDARDPEANLLPDEFRLTPFGKRLRALSLDELPELFNVLRGDMSLVGPRPLLPTYLGRYSSSHRRRHQTLPGLTGLAQVSGRNALSWSQKFDLDVEYVDTRSALLDVSILWRTVRAVISHEGVSAAGDATMPEFTGYESADSRAPLE